MSKVNYLLLLILSLFLKQSFAIDLELTEGINQALPIAIQSLSIDEPLSLELNRLISEDLGLDGRFDVLGKNYNNSSITYWKNKAADSILFTKVSKVGNANYKIFFELLDVALNGKPILSKEYQIEPKDLTAIAHHISDEIYLKLTGERGIFSTKIAYIKVMQVGKKRRYALEISEPNGTNAHSLILSSEPLMSPSWSPDGQKIAFVSFENKRAQIYIVNIETGQRKLITSFPGINGAPAWSPDGRNLALVLSKEGAPKIYNLDLQTHSLRQLTYGTSIDTEPHFSIDGKNILFTSNRGGSPQIYKLLLNNLKVDRLTFEGNYNARASYTYKQNQIVMLHRNGDFFNISLLNANGQIHDLISSPFGESPCLSPNSRLILYASKKDNRGILAMVSIDGKVKRQLPMTYDGDLQDPAWSPYIG